ncbi:hypothetical protein Patl1_26508 [Pistacia atlantica]|uniref:Uncharacterized protein n=1 Tax=Pistacia atlantica TaxID=434234 RepID=A0ACC1AZ15_9ROSI|nr:hypothetical protein Patl1_26508 [Pistacia atlantica]
MELREKSASQLAICEREKRSDRSRFTVVGELRWVHGGELRCKKKMVKNAVKKMVHASVGCGRENGKRDEK